MKPRTAEELAAFYAENPGMEESLKIAAYADFYGGRDRGKDSPRRAYATGLGAQAHAEAQESGRLQQEYERGRSEPSEYISRGGRK